MSSSIEYGTTKNMWFQHGIIYYQIASVNIYNHLNRSFLIIYPRFKVTSVVPDLLPFGAVTG